MCGVCGVCVVNCDVTVPKHTHAAHISTRQFKSKFGAREILCRHIKPIDDGNNKTAHDFTVNYTRLYNIYKRQTVEREEKREKGRV